ncbi:hypothetical protein QMK33_00415 [Hymenobacter sp. H14-R3]|uniref:hypothetical protein n=1 Tax=Hymenobacter sp. H14-R3 TaxID=3046308 RepID=UPI0024BBA1BC|nr:hypothetical protein [Hymenobacter sp. H14-R3]MDJ0363597.1 hypothetical protein [Hymenobacter sp. H14-R3]
MLGIESDMRGWAQVSGSLKFHYFQGDGMACMCSRWKPTNLRPSDFYDGNHDCIDNCGSCNTNRKKSLKKPTMGKLISAHTVHDNIYRTLPIDERWEEIIGLPESNFRMIIYGESGGGKTTFAMELAVMLTTLGKVYYNSSEQGEGKSIQDAFKRAGVKEKCAKGSFMLADRHTFAEMVEYLEKKRSAPFVIIDSLNYMKLTEAQYKVLIEAFPKKVFIIISWSDGKSPKGDHAKAIEYMVDIKVRVNDGEVIALSRFGATEPYRLFPSKKVKKVATGQQLTLLEG